VLNTSTRLAAFIPRVSNDAGSAGKSFYYTPQYARKLTDLKAGVAVVDLEWIEPDMRTSIEAALQALRSLGVKLLETKLPDFPHGALAGTIIGAEGSSIFEQLITSGKVNELVDARQIEGLKAGLDIPAKDYLKAMRIRSLLKRKFRELFADVDLIVAPGRYGIAPLISEPLDGTGNRGIQATRPSSPGMTGLIPAGNLAGLPALSLPCGFSRGMPVSLQIVGPPFSENTLLAVGREFQSRTDWHKRRPPAPAS